MIMCSRFEHNWSVTLHAAAVHRNSYELQRLANIFLSFSGSLRTIYRGNRLGSSREFLARALRACM
jgi:hypothetical protein